MNQLAVRLLVGVAVFLSGCSDDDGSDVLPKDPTAQAGTGGTDGAGGSGGMGGGGTGGSGGGGGSGAPLDAGMDDQCTPVFLDAGVIADAGAGDAGDAGSAPGNGAVSFTTDIYPIVRSLCTPCHSTDMSAGHNIAADDLNEAYSYVDMSTDDVRDVLLGRINGGGMPPDCSGAPGDPGCVTVAQFDLIRRWVAQCFPL